MLPAPPSRVEDVGGRSAIMLQFWRRSKEGTEGLRDFVRRLSWMKHPDPLYRRVHTLFVVLQGVAEGVCWGVYVQEGTPLAKHTVLIDAMVVLLSPP